MTLPAAFSFCRCFSFGPRQMQAIAQIRELVDKAAT